MKKKKIMQISAMILSVALAAGGALGCEQAPDRASDSSTEVEIDSSEQYVTVAEAKEQAQELVGGSLDGIYFPDYIALPDGDSVSVLEVSPLCVREEDSDIFIEAIQGMWPEYDTVDWSQAETRQLVLEPTDTEWSYQKKDEETGSFFAYTSAGDLAFVSGDIDRKDMDSCVKEYDFMYGGDVAGEDDKWELADGECSVAEAVDTVEGLLNEHMAPLEGNAFEYRVQYLYVMENPDTGCYEYNMVIGSTYEGMAIDISSSYERFDSQLAYDVVHGGTYYSAVMRSKGSLDYFRMMYNLISIDSAEEQESIISPLWAAEKVKEEVAHANSMNFTGCGLVYIGEQEGKELEDMPGYYSFSVGSPATLRPYWAFFAAESEAGSANTPYTDTGHGESVLVDAVTGELYYYEEAKDCSI